MDFDLEKWLFWLTFIAGVISAYEVFYARKRRVAGASIPIINDYGHSFFPVLLVVLLLRSFLIEPFIIPSESLEPTLLVGDFIGVNKFTYGLRLPILHNKILSISEPQRGDIMVFRWPPNPKIYYIKRVIGVPGDRISYLKKQLYINGEKISERLVKEAMVQNPQGQFEPRDTYQEKLFKIEHKIYTNPQAQSFDFENAVVPKGYYFVMGDNRDNSSDSRYWGFMPEQNIVGKAVFIWMSWDKKHWHVRWGRLGSGIG